MVLFLRNTSKDLFQLSKGLRHVTFASRRGRAAGTGLHLSSAASRPCLISRFWPGKASDYTSIWPEAQSRSYEFVRAWATGGGVRSPLFLCLSNAPVLFLAQSITTSWWCEPLSGLLTPWFGVHDARTTLLAPSTMPVRRICLSHPVCWSSLMHFSCVMCLSNRRPTGSGAEPARHTSRADRFEPI
jgi:hypothetical protein